MLFTPSLLVRFFSTLFACLSVYVADLQSVYVCIRLERSTERSPPKPPLGKLTVVLSLCMDAFVADNLGREKRGLVAKNIYSATGGLSELLSFICYSLLSMEATTTAGRGSLKFQFQAEDTHARANRTVWSIEETSNRPRCDTAPIIERRRLSQAAW